MLISREVLMMDYFIGSFEEYQRGLDEIDPERLLNAKSLIEFLSFIKYFRIISDDLLEKTLRDGIGVLVTEDKKLQQIVEEEGLAIESPIEESLKRKIEEWEEKILLEKGLPRILQRIYFWLLNYDLEVAKEFQQQTRFFKKVP